MNEFIDSCRREWKRLRVPDEVASEMAADLAADLREAESEGVSAEEVLGAEAFNPRVFAESWARERGVVRLPPKRWLDRRTLLLGSATVVVVALIIGLALGLATRESKSAFAAEPAPTTSTATIAPAVSVPQAVTTVASTIAVPRLLGLKSTLALRVGRSAGFRVVVVVNRRKHGSKSGVVLGQAPRPGAKAAPGATLRISVAGG